jgi:hypothetical protein
MRRGRTPIWLLFAGLAVGEAPALAGVAASFILDAGYRTAELEWSIAGSPAGEDPDVLSELTWSDLELWQLRAAGDLVFGRRVVLHGSIAAGTIVAGNNRDSDYAGDRRTLEFSRSENAGDGDDVLDLALALGYRFSPRTKRPWRVTPLAGVSYSEQDLTITDGFQTVSDQALAARIGVGVPPVGPFGGLDSSYETRWKGPWVGVETEVGLGRSWGLRGGVRRHWPDYDAEANWNLREDFAHPVSFEHLADGTATVLSLAGYFRAFGSRRGLLRLDYEDWSTDPGLDRVFLADGTAAVTRLNEVDWRSLTVSLGLEFSR